MKMKCIFPIPMNNIYRKEQEISSKENNVKETQTLFECRKNTTIKVTTKYTIHGPGREGAFFLKNTLHFHQKVSQKHTKNENTKSRTRPT